MMVLLAEGVNCCGRKAQLKVVSEHIQRFGTVPDSLKLFLRMDPETALMVRDSCLMVPNPSWAFVDKHTTKHSETILSLLDENRRLGSGQVQCVSLRGWIPV